MAGDVKPDGSDRSEARPVLAFQIHGAVGNPLNKRWSHWGSRARWSRAWRTATEAAIYAWWFRATRAEQLDARALVGRPLAMTFTVHLGRWLDPHDALPAACKPALDALCAALGVDDGPRAGHQVTYAQTRERDPLAHGIAVTVRPATSAEAAAR
jgi:hypothetical protein